MDKQAQNSLLDEIMASLPQGWTQLRDDMDRNLHSLLRNALARLDLVTRDEFEIQREVLARTRARCDALAEQVAALEARLEQKPG